MDRGRVGYDLESNLFLKEKHMKHRRQVHMDRLKKIKNRKPGSSPTLDNNPPSTLGIEAFSRDPRKEKIKNERMKTIERQNKVLLQRISKILTAPPKITPEDYDNMKKLCASLKGSDTFEAKQMEKQQKIFFERVKKTGPYYHPEEWERDYQRQLEGQKFMRQVKYTRPKDFVDPLSQPPQENEQQASPKKAHVNLKELMSNDSKKTRRVRTTGSGHVNRVRHMKKLNSASGKLCEESEHNSSKKCTDDDTDNVSGAIDESVEAKEEEKEPELKLLASTERHVSVAYTLIEHGEEHTKEKYVDSEVKCWLGSDDTVTIYICEKGAEEGVRAVCQLDFPTLISVTGKDFLNSETLTVEDVASDVVYTVRAGVDSNGTCSVVMHTADMLADGQSEPPTPVDHPPVTEQDALEMLQDFSPMTFDQGASLPLIIKGRVVRQDSISALVESNNTEKIQSLIHIKRIAEEKAEISAHMVCDSKNTYVPKGKKVAVPMVEKDTVLVVRVGLPSILSIDVELVNDFFHNIISNIRIQFDVNTNECGLILE